MGTGDHPSALVGSSDGFLYALDPCAGKIDWAFDLKFAVGNPIFADAAGSGVDQILVPAADGYIHALQQRVLDAPAFVNDNAPGGAGVVVGPDLDVVETANALAASWAPVTGADGYQVAALTEGNTYVTQPDWVSVGNVTSAVVENVSLAPGKKYFFAVRAVSKTQGSSLETRSNGAVVEPPKAPDGGTGDGGLWGDEDAGSDAGPPEADGGHTTPPPAGPEPQEGGCGCGLVGEEAPAGAAALLSLGMLAVAARRSRSRPDRRSDRSPGT